MGKNFKIYVAWNGKNLNLNCDMIYESEQVQRIKISLGKKYFTLQNDYPLVRIAPPNKKPPVKWKVIEGKPTDAHFLADVLEALEAHIKENKN